MAVAASAGSYASSVQTGTLAISKRSRISRATSATRRHPLSQPAGPLRRSGPCACLGRGARAGCCGRRREGGGGSRRAVARGGALAITHPGDGPGVALPRAGAVPPPARPGLPDGCARRIHCRRERDPITRLLREYPGQFLLIKGAEVYGGYDTQGEPSLPGDRNSQTLPTASATTKGNEVPRQSC